MSDNIGQEFAVSERGPADIVVGEACPSWSPSASEVRCFGARTQYSEAGTARRLADRAFLVGRQAVPDAGFVDRELVFVAATGAGSTDVQICAPLCRRGAEPASICSHDVDAPAPGHGARPPVCENSKTCHSSLQEDHDLTAASRRKRRRSAPPCRTLRPLPRDRDR